MLSIEVREGASPPPAAASPPHGEDFAVIDKVFWSRNFDS